MGEEFKLYDLVVAVEGDPQTFVCSHSKGAAFSVRGENLVFGKHNSFSLYSLAALLPILPAKQRSTHKNDWMTSDELIACPDPNCGAQFRISRIGQRAFKHSEVTKVPLS